MALLFLSPNKGNLVKYQPKHARMAPEQNTAARAVTGAAIGAAALTTVSVAQASSASAESSTDILAKIVYCESSGNPHAQNAYSTASGLFQDLTTTWRSLPGTAGYANAKDAPASVQIAANKAMYAQLGTAPWLASKPCWSRLAAAPFTLESLAGSSSNVTSAVTTTTSTNAAAAVTTTKPATVTATVQATSTAAKPVTTTPKPTVAAPSIKLTAADYKALGDLSAIQKKQAWWNADAARGTTVLRTITSSAVTRTGSDARAAKAGTLAAGTRVTGHYVNTDWFLITAGSNAGQYVNTSFVDLSTANVKNGYLSAAQLATLPSSLSAAGQQLTPSAAKQLITTNAAYRTATGHNLYVTGAYRSYATQASLYRRYGAAYAAAPGVSTHGLGLAINATPTASATSWLKAHSAALGWSTSGVGLLNSTFVG